MLGSGATIAMAAGEVSPEIRDGFTAAPEVVNSPIVAFALSTTKRFEPSSAMPDGTLNPEISAACTVAPEVVYSPNVPPL